MSKKPTTNIPALDRILEWPKEHRVTLAEIDEQRVIHERWMADEISAADVIELTNQLKLRASRKCADGYANPFDVNLDNAAADTIANLRYALAKAETKRANTLETLECVVDYFWNPDREPGGFREDDIEELVRAAISSLEDK